MNKSNYFLTLLVLICSIFATTKALHQTPCEKNLVDLVIYSYNRPLQLYALLESLEKYVMGAGEVSVIYKAGNDNYSKAYKQLSLDFPAIIFFEQNNALEGDDFKPLVIHCAFESPHKYVSFLVDDIIITDKIDLEYCVQMLKNTGAYGFYLRLGKNIAYSDMAKIALPLPSYTIVEDGVNMWRFRDGIEHYWSYANINDMTVYKKSDIRNDLLSISFKTTFYEAAWHAKSDPNKFGLFFDHSKMVNISINLVIDKKNWGQFSQEWRQKMGEYTPEKLLEKFNAGLKVDISQFYKIENRAPHIESEFRFIKRSYT